MKSLSVFAFLFLALLFSSCDRKECKNNNPVFDEYSYYDDVYKNELAAQIETIGLQNLRTWLSDYIEKNDNTYLVFYIQNDSLCAKVMVKMNHWNKLEYLKINKGKGRFHAEFVDLVFISEKTKNGNTEFFYETFSHIID